MPMLVPALAANNTVRLLLRQHVPQMVGSGLMCSIIVKVYHHGWRTLNRLQASEIQQPTAYGVAICPRMTTTEAAGSS